MSQKVLSGPKIVSVEAVPWDVPMRAPYRSAQRITTTARNVLVRVVLDDGSVGFGESAPATYVTGETQESVLGQLQAHLHVFIGAAFLDAAPRLGAFRKPGARGAMEIAVYDAFARADNRSLLHFVNGGSSDKIAQQTDLSLPLLTPVEAQNRAEQAALDGYRAIKIKIGGPSIDEDEARVRAIARASPDAILRLDGNQGFAPENAIRFLDGLSDLVPRIELLEQPTKAGDDDALQFVQERIPVPVFADEAIHNAEDAARLLYKGACKGIVLKLAKSGLFETLDIAHTAVVKQKGLLMFGCMMETRLAISAALQLSAVIAAKHSIQPLLDLDGHLLTKADGLVSGGFEQSGDVLTFDPGVPGLGVDVVWPPPHNSDT